jgi:hypothetical protein
MRVSHRGTDAESFYDATEAWIAPLLRPASNAAARACCCSAPPRYQVVLPPKAGRPIVELLLCAHHLRRSLDAVATAHGWVYDADGRLVDACA